ncbi:MAG: ribonuclease HIII [Bradymonadia bacterium]|jgi:ribonuclease HIII
MTHSLKLDPGQQVSIRAKLASEGFAFSQPDHTFWQGRGDGAVISFYKSGKVVVQGSGADQWADTLTGAGAKLVKSAAPRAKGSKTAASRVPASGEPFGPGIAKLPKPVPNAWIGIDETGKGDYFGPLVVVAARVEMSQLPLLKELGVADSKSLNDKLALRIADDLREVVPFSAVVLLPPGYNDLYAKIQNLNHLLAWAHAESAEDVLGKTDAELIISDQFAKANLVGRRLKERGKQCRFFQRTKAEDDPAVACASILARAIFLRQLDQLGHEFGMTLPKGASGPVLAAAKRIVQERGAVALADVAKLHFKTTEKAQR